MHFRLLTGLALNGLLVAAAPAVPTIQLDSGTFKGVASGKTNKFLGIPFAKPPVGDLRFQLPVANAPYSGSYDATDYSPSCAQMAVNLPINGLVGEAANYVVNSIFGGIFPDAEDCLTLNVVVPSGTTANSKLPVVVWIYGGGFLLGSTSMYDGASIVSRSIEMKTPVIYVSMNYRMNGFGFMASKEVKAAGVGNLGLHDQREALRWIQKYISKFGGDPTKVTIWGESAGAISVALHMQSNGGNPEGLFRAGFMQSGGPIPVGDITNGQVYYDFVVSQTGCSSAADTLACLRTVPYKSLKAAIDKTPGIFSYQSLHLSWLPRTDGVFLTEQPMIAAQKNQVANIPYITGSCDDEGTLFSLSTLNITTDAQLKKYIKTVFLPGISDSALDNLSKYYPDDIREGSPFDTGILNALTPQFKRIAAFQGDGVLQGPRRWMLKHTVPSNPNVWAFLSKRFKALPILGSAHATDILNVYGGGEMADYLIRFAVNLNPNGNGLFDYQWPRYNLQDKKLLTFRDGLIPLEITRDTYRTEAMEYINNIALNTPV